MKEIRKPQGKPQSARKTPKNQEKKNGKGGFCGDCAVSLRLVQPWPLSGMAGELSTSCGFNSHPRLFGMNPQSGLALFRAFPAKSLFYVRFHFCSEFLMLLTKYFYYWQIRENETIVLFALSKWLFKRKGGFDRVFHLYFSQYISLSISIMTPSMSFFRFLLSLLSSFLISPRMTLNRPWR